MRPSKSCCAFKRFNCAVDRELRQLALNLERIAQLLGRDAHAVQAIGQVDPAGMLDRGPQFHGAAGGLRAGFGERASLRHRARPRRGDANQPLAQLVELRGLDLGSSMSRRRFWRSSFTACANAGDGAHGRGVLLLELGK